jgi:hypothetical protein
VALSNQYGVDLEFSRVKVRNFWHWCQKFFSPISQAQDSAQSRPPRTPFPSPWTPHCSWTPRSVPSAASLIRREATIRFRVWSENRGCWQKNCSPLWAWVLGARQGTSQRIKAFGGSCWGAYPPLTCLEKLVGFYIEGLQA